MKIDGITRLHVLIYVVLFTVCYFSTCLMHSRLEKKDQIEQPVKYKVIKVIGYKEQPGIKTVYNLVKINSHDYIMHLSTSNNNILYEHFVGCEYCKDHLTTEFNGYSFSSLDGFVSDAMKHAKKLKQGSVQYQTITIEEGRNNEN